MSVSARHELLVELFRNRPELAPELAQRVASLPIPERFSARTLAGDGSLLAPTEFRADCVVEVRSPSGVASLIIVEVQLRADPDKRFTWPLYVAATRLRHRHPVALLVVTTSKKTAAWAREPIPLGHPDFQLTPLVVSPAAVPLVPPASSATTSPELAVLSVIAHGRGPAGRAVAEAAVRALRAGPPLDTDRTRLYLDGILSALSPEDLIALEDLMRRNWQPLSEWGKKLKAEEEAAIAAATAKGLQRGIEQGIEQGIERGIARGQTLGQREEARRIAERLLTRRFGALPPAVDARLRAASREELERWALRCLDANTLDEVLQAH